LYPNTYLQTFWRLEFKPQIFVAMSFAPKHRARFENIIDPAIRAISSNNIPLFPYRVDLSKSGDSILTEINDGIAHSLLILADVSTIEKDSTGNPYRNGNVMYEVGIALACRQPHEVLLIRDDNDDFLFDVSTIPHKHINFTDHEQAKRQLTQELMSRLKEANYINDARVQMAIAKLSSGEINLLKYMATLPPTTAWGRENEGDVAGLVSIPRLLDKQLIRILGEFEAGYPAYVPTPLGYAVAKRVENLRKIKADKKESDPVS
jgi:hypothetical protein